MSQALPATRVVAVIGAGAMGAGIAQVAAQAGHTVRLLDAREGAAEQAIANIRKMFGKLADKGRMSAEQAEAAGARKKLVENGAMRKDLRTYEIDVPTTKHELQQFLADFGGGDVSLLVATRKLLAE